MKEATSLIDILNFGVDVETDFKTSTKNKVEINLKIQDYNNKNKIGSSNIEEIFLKLSSKEMSHSYNKSIHGGYYNIVYYIK